VSKTRVFLGTLKAYLVVWISVINFLFLIAFLKYLMSKKGSQVKPAPPAASAKGQFDAKRYAQGGVSE
jgi:hypothetical protein